MFKFPYDTQICHLEFGNVMEADVAVNVSILQEYGFLLDFYSLSNEFTLKSTQAYRKSWQVSKQYTVWWQFIYKTPGCHIKDQNTTQNHINKDYNLIIVTWAWE